MSQEAPSGRSDADQRRRFLRESVRGSLPLLVEWVADQARGIARLARSQTGPIRTSPPPQAEDGPPAEVKTKLDHHYQEFARDNEDSDPSAR